MSWYELYRQEIKEKGTVLNYIGYKISYKKNLIKLIKKYATSKMVIETGSGTGVISTYLANLGYDVLGIDIDDKMINLANDIAIQYKGIKKPTFKNDSIFDLNYKDDEFSVAFSNGVLEHFNDKEIIDILSKQLRIANTVIFSIPTKYFNTEEAMYGNERYMDYSCWRELVKKSGGVIIEEKSMHFNNIWKRIINYRKWFRPYPFRIFVVVKK